MRVAVVVEQCWHRVPGGTAGAVVDQVAAMAKTGRVQQVGVAALHRHPPPEPWRPAIPIHHLALPRAALYRTWHRWRRPAVEHATGPVDVVHATGYAIPPRTRPLVVTMHDLAWRRDPSMFTANGVRFFEAGLRFVVADADLVLCPSQATLDDCAAAGIEHDRLRHVPWGMDGGTIDAGVAGDVARVRRAHGLEGRYVLSVGTLEPHKNLPRLLDAFARLTADGDGRHTDVTLAVVGPEGWGESLAAPTRPAWATGCGWWGSSPATTWHRSTGAQPSCVTRAYWEEYGLPVAEALAAGAPVVTSAGAATEELVAGGVGLVVDPRDPDSRRRRPRLGSRRRRPREPPAPGHAQAGGRDDVGDYTAALTIAAYKRRRRGDGCSDERASRGASGPERPAAKQRERGAMRVGCNLLWLVPGAVGGSETAVVSLLREIGDRQPEDVELSLYVLDAFAATYPDLVDRFPTRTVPPDGPSQAAPGRRREHVAGEPGPPRPARPRPPHERRPAGGPPRRGDRHGSRPAAVRPADQLPPGEAGDLSTDRVRARSASPGWC